MLTQDELIAYFEQRLPDAQRAELERKLADDPHAQSILAGQENIDLALRVLLGPQAAHERVKQSIFTVLRGASDEQLAAHVMEEARAARTEEPRPGSRRSRAAGELSWWKARFVSRPRLALLGAALALVAIAFGLLLLPPRAPAAVEIGRLAVVVGEPWITSGGQGTRTVAAASSSVRLGDRLETGDADRAEVQFQDGTILRLQFNTAVEISNLKSQIANLKSPVPRPPEILLLRGQVWTKVQKAANGAAMPYAVRTVAATALARGTEFGVKLNRLTNAPSAVGNARADSNVVAVLTVKEGTVDFFNSFGSVQATAMTESTARADAPPSEPKRLQTLQVVQLDATNRWSLLTSPLEWPEAAVRLVGGGGDIRWQVRDIPGPEGRSEVRITQLPTTSVAARAGLRVGDALTTLDGQSLTNVRQLTSTVLLRPGAVVKLGVQRTNEQQVVAVTVARATNWIRGPKLRAAATAQLTGQLRSWLSASAGHMPDSAEQARRSEEAAGLSRSSEIRVAAFNDLGVVFELDDALGPAIRAYGRAVYLEPAVALYRFNLALALRKIGSFERAAEEFAEAARLEPESVPARKRVAEIRSLLGAHDQALALTESLLQSAPNDHGAWELKAQLLLKLKRPTEAVAPARRAAELDPDCPVAHAYLAEACHAAGKLSDAQAAWAEALERAPFEAAFVANLGVLQRDLGQASAAEMSFRRALELRPDFALAYGNLGEALADTGRHAEAAAAFQKARELDPNDAGAHLRFADMALQRRQFDLAERAYQECLGVAPQDAAAIFGLGEVHRHRGQSAEAERAYRRAIELEPNFAAPHTGLGVVFYDRGDVDEAERMYRRAIELKPREAAPYHNLGTLYREARGDLDAAERWFRQALERSPGDGEALGGLGLVAKDRGNLAEAERLLRQALQRAPESSALHNNLGELLRERGRSEEAEPLYRKALELDPDNPAPYGNLGILQAQRRQFEEAEKTFRALLARSKGNFRLPALVNLASVCGDAGKLQEAELLFRQALDLAPREPRVANSFASFLADHQLKLDEALALASRAVTAAPSDPNFLDTLGWVQTQRGDLVAAERTLENALKLAGQEPPAAEIRAHLEKTRAKKKEPAGSQLKPINP